jgi:hypothetical protein
MAIWFSNSQAVKHINALLKKYAYCCHVFENLNIRCLQKIENRPIISDHCS